MEVASGVTVAVVVTMAAGLRRWSQSLDQRIERLSDQLTSSVRRLHSRLDGVAGQTQADRERIVRLETALLLTPPSPKVSERALDALLAPPPAPAPQPSTEDDLGD